MSQQDAPGFLMLRTAEAQLHQPVPAEVFHLGSLRVDSFRGSAVCPPAVIFHRQEELCIGLPFQRLVLIEGEIHVNLGVIDGNALHHACIDLALENVENLLHRGGLLIIQAADQLRINLNRIAVCHGIDQALPGVQGSQQAGEAQNAVIVQGNADRKAVNGLCVRAVLRSGIGGLIRDRLRGLRIVFRSGAGLIGRADVGTANIQNGAIVTAHILDGNITTAKIADLAVTSGKIADLAVTTAKIAQAAITNAQIANAAVDTAQIALGAITAALIAQGAVGTAQIADASITDAKIVSLNADVITSGTLATERLIIRGNDGLIYEINAQASGLSMQELSDAKYQQGLAGSVLVARSVTAEQIAAATITANEILSGTITGDKIAAATIEGSNIKAGTITTTHVSSDFGSTLDLSSNVGINQTVSKVYTDMDDLIGYRIEIVSTSDILSDSIQNTTLTARVWHGSENVTDSLPASRFQWRRKSADDTADAIWNAAHTGMKSILLTTRDVYFSATYDCELVKEDS